MTQDRYNHKRIGDAFAVLRDKLHSWKPDAVILIGDDQAENFKRDNLPTFCLYTGSEVQGYPFHAASDDNNVWKISPDAKCDKPVQKLMVARLLDFFRCKLGQLAPFTSTH